MYGILIIIIFIAFIICVILSLLNSDNKIIIGGSLDATDTCRLNHELARNSLNIIPFEKYGGNLTTSNKMSFPKFHPRKLNFAWTQYKSWKSLKKDIKATNTYLNDKQSILENPNIDWTQVMLEVLPKLKENYEYIGLINIKEDNKTMYVSEIHKSSIENGTIDDDTTFAAISSELLEKMANIPALFMFHTHPDDKRACQLPSSQDIAAAVYYATHGHYAASILISTFGIMLYGVNNEMMKYFYKNPSNDFKLAQSNYIHDIVAAHESMRSWNKHRIKDYVDFFAQYRMFLYIYPSSRFIANKSYVTYDLLNSIDHEFIEQHRDYSLELMRKH